jgi:hypothetical protein
LRQRLKGSIITFGVSSSRGIYGPESSALDIADCMCLVSGKERLLNEAEALQFVRQHTDISVPAVNCHFEDDGAYYLISEYIEGVSMSELSEEQKVVVRQELEIHRAKLKTLKSRRLGGPSGLVIPPYRVLNRAETDYWNLQPSSNRRNMSFVTTLCPSRTSIVNPDTLKIRAIIDREYAGFFPARFDYPFCNRLGPSSAINGEVDDSLELLQFLDSQERGSSQGAMQWSVAL